MNNALIFLIFGVTILSVITACVIFTTVKQEEKTAKELEEIQNTLQDFYDNDELLSENIGVLEDKVFELEKENEYLKGLLNQGHPTRRKR